MNQTQTVNLQDNSSILIDIPEKILPLVQQRARYKVLYGGRGSAKSWQCARALLALGHHSSLRILCARELQISIRDSVHKLLSDQAAKIGLGSFYNIDRSYISHKYTGTEFLFEGLRHNASKIKSMEGIDIVWVEEAEKVSHSSWQILIPTVRKPGSEIWVTFNPDEEEDPTYIRFVKNPPEDAIVIKLNYTDNPWFPEELRREMKYLRRVDPDAAAHVWDGECRKRSDAQVLNGKWSIDIFDAKDDWEGPYYGVDWGFSTDPTAIVRSWIGDGCLWIDYEAGGTKVENSGLAALFDQVPGTRENVLRADCARPETISHVRGEGFAIQAAEKWQGSVEDGVTYLRSFEHIYIHERCKATIREARLWAYKIDPLTEDVTRKLVDKHNHYWDAMRYAHQPMIKRQRIHGLKEHAAAAGHIAVLDQEDSPWAGEEQSSALIEAGVW